MVRPQTNSSRRIRILVAEDHAVVREGTCHVLEREPDFEVVAEAGNGAEAVELAMKLQPDVALVDIVMPELNGIEATRLIKKRCPATAVLILSAYDDDQFVFGFIEAGAAGYLLKSAHGHEVVSAIRKVCEGEPVLSPTIARKVLAHFAARSGNLAVSKTAETNRLSRLSPREREAFDLASRGLSNKDIAKQLSISVRTVQAHLASAFRKLEVSSRTEAMLLGLKEGRLNLDDMRLSND